MVIGISIMRDEADIVRRSVQNMLANVDAVIVADNRSRDDTRQILDGLAVLHGDRLAVVDDTEPGHYQSRKMTALAERAAAMGADWVVPFDADEIWLSRTGHIGTALDALPPEALIADAMIFDHIATPDGFDWRKAAPLPLRKVACRPVPGFAITEGNHGAIYPDADRYPLTACGLLEIRHYQFRSVPQFTRKVRQGAEALRAAPEVDPETGGHWRELDALAEREGEGALRAVFAERFYSVNPAADPTLVRDPCPV